MLAQKIIKRQINSFNNDPVPNSQIQLKDEENFLNLEVIIYGYDDTPYGGGKFLLEFIFPPLYHFWPPKIYFRTKIYHLNVNEDGMWKHPFLGSDWSPAFSISQIILIIQATMSDPINEESCIAPHVEEVYFSDKQKYRNIATEWTIKYAIN